MNFQINFTGFSDELRDMIGSLKMRAKQGKCSPRPVKEIKEKKEKEVKGKSSGHMIKCLLTEFRSGRTGKYLALGHGVRTSLRSVRTP